MEWRGAADTKPPPRFFMRIAKEQPMEKKTPASLRIVEAWQEAVNTRDSARLLDLSDPEIEVVGPRGSGFGRQVLQEWLDRAGLTLTTLRAFARGDQVVLEQKGLWRAVDTGDVTGDKRLASAFRVNDQHQIARFVRYDELGQAFEATGLDPMDEIH
jgi:hypothetical protein